MAIGLRLDKQTFVSTYSSVNESKYLVYYFAFSLVLFREKYWKTILFSNYY